MLVFWLTVILFFIIRKKYYIIRLRRSDCFLFLISDVQQTERTNNTVTPTTSSNSASNPSFSRIRTACTYIANLMFAIIQLIINVNSVVTHGIRWEEWEEEALKKMKLKWKKKNKKHLSHQHLKLKSWVCTTRFFQPKCFSQGAIDIGLV